MTVQADETPDVPVAAPPSTSASSPSLRLLLALAATSVVIAGLRGFSGSLGPIVASLILVITVHPLQAWLQRMRVPMWLAATANIAVIYAMVLGLAASLGWAVFALANTLPQYAGAFGSLRDSALSLLSQLGVTQSQVVTAVSNIDPNQLISLAQTLVTGLTSGVTSFTFVLVLVLFFAMDAAVFPKLLAQAAWSHPDAVEALRTFARGTRRFLVVSTVFGAIVAALDWVALLWLGVPLAMLWALVAFVTNYIANIGFFVGVVPPVLLALLANGPQDALWVFVAYTVINVVVQNLIQPRVVGNAVGLSASLTFLSVIFWGYVLGGLGALLAVPLSLLARAVLVDADPGNRWLLPIIAGSSRGVPRRPPVLGARTGSTLSPAEVETAPLLAAGVGMPEPVQRVADGPHEDDESSPQPPGDGASAGSDGADQRRIAGRERS